MILKIIVVLFPLILSIIHLSGKASWMINYFNCLSEEAKANCDKKKLSRALGVSLMAITILLALILFVYLDDVINSIDKNKTGAEKPPFLLFY